MVKLGVLLCLLLAGCDHSNGDRSFAYDECIDHRAGTPEQCADASLKLYPKGPK